MKTASTLKEVNFPELSKEEQPRLLGDNGLPPDKNEIIDDEDTSII